MVRTNLKKFCVKVTNNYERAVALTFYGAITGYQESEHSSPDVPFGEVRYIGILGGTDGCGYEPYTICATTPGDTETIIPFENIHQLATSTQRRSYLKEALRLWEHQKLVPTVSVADIPTPEFDNQFFPRNMSKYN